MLWISALSTRRLSAAIILPWWDFRPELCKSKWLHGCFVVLSPHHPPPIHPSLLCSVSSVQHFALSCRWETSPDGKERL